MPRRRELLGFVAAVITAAALLLGALEISGPHTSADFICLYSAGKTVLQGDGAKLYDYSTQQQVERAYTGHIVPLLYDHAPPEALLFVPFALFGYPTAYLLWAGVNLFLLGICVFLLRGWFLRLSSWDVLLFAAVMLIPLLAAIWQGQDSLLILLFYLGAFRLLERAHDFKAGSVLALALFKIQLVAPFLVLGVRGRTRRFYAGFLAAAAGLAVVSVAAVGLRVTLGYPALLWSLNRKSNLLSYHISPGSMANLRGMAYALFSTLVPEHFLNLGIAAVSVLLLLWAAIALRGRTRRDRNAFAVIFSLDLLVTLLVSWHLLLHDLSLLFLPALLLLAATSSGALEGRRDALLLRGSLIVAFIGEVCGVAWFPKQFAGACVGLLLLLWSCASLGMRQGSVPAQ